MLQNIVKLAVSNYKNQTGGAQHTSNEIDVMVLFITFILVIFILAFFGKYLWNEILVKAISVCKPINSWIDLLGLVILFNILFMR